MVLSCGLVYECIVCQSRHVVKMQYLLHKVFRSRYFSPYCHYREFALSHDTPSPAAAGVALGGGGPHGHSGNIEQGGIRKGLTKSAMSARAAAAGGGAGSWGAARGQGGPGSVYSEILLCMLWNFKRTLASPK